MSAESFLIKINRLLLPLSHSSFFHLVFATLILLVSLVQVHAGSVATCPFSASHTTTSPLPAVHLLQHLPLLLLSPRCYLSWPQSSWGVTRVASSNAVPPFISLKQQSETAARVLLILSVTVGL